MHDGIICTVQLNQFKITKKRACQVRSCVNDIFKSLPKCHRVYESHLQAYEHIKLFDNLIKPWTRNTSKYIGTIKMKNVNRGHIQMHQVDVFHFSRNI